MARVLCNVDRRAGHASGQARHVVCHNRIEQGGIFGSGDEVIHIRWEVTVFEELFALTDVGEVVVGRKVVLAHLLVRRMPEKAAFKCSSLLRCGGRRCSRMIKGSRVAFP